jgi:hypothetical protein
MEKFVEELCCCCMVRPSTQLLLPCRHQCLCTTCVPIVIGTKPSCPICRTDIKQYGDEKTLEQSHQPIEPDIFAAYEKKRADYFADANPIIEWDQKTLKMKFYKASGFNIGRKIMEELCVVLGFKRPNCTKSSFCGTKIIMNNNGETIIEPASSEYEYLLEGGAKHISEEEMVAFVKNCAFQQFLSHKK